MSFFRAIELKKWELLIVNMLFIREYRLWVGAVMVQPRYFRPLHILASLTCTVSLQTKNIDCIGGLA
jgi:hypothetical protein